VDPPRRGPRGHPRPAGPAPLSGGEDDKRRRRPENYPLRYETRALYSDVDANRHVNNVAYARWFEEGRAQLNEQVAGPGALLNPPPGVQFLLVSLRLDYLAQVPYPSTVTVASAVGRISGASYVIVHGLFHQDRCAALGESVVVRAQDGRPVRLTEAERAALAPLTLGAAGSAPPR
jgi:acyl-CoA thioester hydrolase